MHFFGDQSFKLEGEIQANTVDRHSRHNHLQSQQFRSDQSMALLRNHISQGVRKIRIRPRPFQEEQETRHDEVRVRIPIGAAVRAAAGQIGRRAAEAGLHALRCLQAPLVGNETPRHPGSESVRDRSARTHHGPAAGRLPVLLARGNLFCRRQPAHCHFERCGVSPAAHLRMCSTRRSPVQSLGKFSVPRRDTSSDSEVVCVYGASGRAEARKLSTRRAFDFVDRIPRSQVDSPSSRRREKAFVSDGNLPAGAGSRFLQVIDEINHN